MGLPSTMDANEGIQLCVFDSRRGQREGQELDKILFFYPPDCPYSVQLSVIGLSGGMITFTRLFSPDAACEVIEAERHSHVFYQAEPDIWMVLIVEKVKDSESIWRCDALQAILREIHSLFTMFNGSLQNILDKQPSGALARSCLYTFITDYLTDFRVSKKIKVPTFRDCLKERRTVQMLTISREVAIEVQSLATVIGSSCIGGITCNSIILFQDLLVSTTLSPGDTANMFTYAVLRLTPHALSSKTSSWSYLRKGVSSSNVTVRSASLNTGSSLEDYQDGSCNTSPRGQGQTYHTARLLQTDNWSKGKDGFLVSGIHGEVGNLVDIPPIVWLQQTEEQVYLCVYQHRNLTIIFLIPVCTLTDGETGISHAKKQFLENASEKIVYVEEKLSKGFGGENAYHVSGYRYLLVDRDKSISRASPPGKVTTLAKDSLLAFNNLREEVDLKKARANREKPDCENNFEMCIRAKNNAWLIAKIARGRELYMVLEKANETLLYASDAVEKFSNRYCDGAFSLD
ncbi:vacuolar fusion protein CCZ1 homolog isoform X1 [Zingiber officinale]|uniref:vacuolar fusion protein CCZ1 homolog isoform X1 n=1 Tax=Zingiber officinale TaxID=94328 RepID=UPI001C4DA19C|nr:vacuolar fusion protein CCZ1 homolog isoform X1 [Zingiber officinale]XP_042417584.1 vacuolar fusion protein CCZ1 homolog isoform X1 [Zingiber officinale]